MNTVLLEFPHTIELTICIKCLHWNVTALRKCYYQCGLSHLPNKEQKRASAFPLGIINRFQNIFYLQVLSSLKPTSMSKKSFLSDLLFIFYGIYKNSFFGGLLTALSLPKSAWFSLRFTWIQLTVFTLLENLVDHWLESIWKVRNAYNLTRKKNCH